MSLNKKKEYVGPALLIVVSIIVAIAFAVVASDRPLTNLEGVMLQAFSLSAGLIGSYFFGRLSAREAAMEFIKPHARSSFRRLLSLYRSLGRLATEIELSRTRENEKNTQGKATLDKLAVLVTEQLYTADDALEDWKDIVPEEVEEISGREPKKGTTNE